MTLDCRMLRLRSLSVRVYCPALRGFRLLCQRRPGGVRSGLPEWRAKERATLAVSDAAAKLT